MAYACTVFLKQDVARVAPYVDYLKIASFEAGDNDLLAEAIRWHGRVILSTGMGYEHCGSAKPWAVLHCVSAYPAPMAEMNLRAMKHHKGLSDHSRHPLTGAVAVGARAKVIETHYRLDTCHPSNPDYAVAFTPAEFTQYVKNIRDAEAMMGDGIKRRQPCEEWALPYRVSQ
jgi:N,N'-diacetyllegionaminate synthase